MWSLGKINCPPLNLWDYCVLFCFIFNVSWASKHCATLSVRTFFITPSIYSSLLSSLPYILIFNWKTHKDSVVFFSVIYTGHNCNIEKLLGENLKLYASDMVKYSTVWMWVAYCLLIFLDGWKHCRTLVSTFWPNSRIYIYITKWKFSLILSSPVIRHFQPHLYGPYHLSR